jgi:hypothetical protein
MESRLTYWKAGQVTLEEEFELECRADVERCRELGYMPTGWISMMNRPGGAVAAARRLLESGDIQSGFERLIRSGHVELTVEYAALQERWYDLFDDRHREAARWRLEQVRR